MFKNRLRAGIKLAKRLEKFKGRNTVVLAIPRGGVPVAFPIAERLKSVLDVVIPRKIPIPGNPEAGFGAVTIDGTIVLNERLVRELNLTQQQIEILTRSVVNEIQRRTRIYRGGRKFPDIKDKIAIIVDDGLASGFTMIAAIRSLRKYNPVRIVVAVPVSSADALREVTPYTDEIICLISRETHIFAVADFYEEFPDLTDEEVVEYLERAGVKNDIPR